MSTEVLPYRLACSKYDSSVNTLFRYRRSDLTGINHTPLQNP